jgi:N-acyl-L-homoserine lactone synthetase
MEMVRNCLSDRHLYYGKRKNVSNSGIKAKNIVSCNEIEQAYRLRHEVFSKELTWVPAASDGREVDAYDENAEHFGVFRNHKILSYLRLVMPSYRFMLEKEFSCLVSPGHEIRKSSDTCEVSRLCVSDVERGTKVESPVGKVGVSMLLYRSVYQWCIRYGVRHLYLVVEYRVYRLLSMLGFPCALVGEPTRMPDGVVAVAALMDWRRFEEINWSRRPELVSWFNQSQAFQGGLPLQPLEPGSQLQAFS